MQFESTHIKGKGRGKPMGFPTINLKIPENFDLKGGVYAVKVRIDNKIINGALHFGPTPTFNEQEKSLEIYLIEVTKVNNEFENLDGKIIKVEVIRFLRDVIKFRLVEDLVKQIKEDVGEIKKLT